jgi:hypothetical protein
MSAPSALALAARLAPISPPNPASALLAEYRGLPVTPTARNTRVVAQISSFDE